MAIAIHAIKSNLVVQDQKYKKLKKEKVNNLLKWIISLRRIWLVEIMWSGWKDSI